MTHSCRLATLLVCLLLALPAIAARHGAAVVEASAVTQEPLDEFVPIRELPPEEQLPAAPLLIGAYIFAWVAIFGYLFSLWRRLGQVERELQDVSGQLGAEAGREAPGIGTEAVRRP